MNTLIVSGIILEVVIALGGIFFIKKLQKKQTRQPGLSNRIVKNLKF